MNQNIAIDFIKNAQAAGLPQEQAEQFLVENLPGYKTAAQQFDDVITHILTEAGVEKTADTSSYAAGFLYEAVNKGVDDNSAIEIAKQACDAQRKAGNFPPIPNNMKKANDQSTPDSYAVSAYAEGFMKQAQAFGYTEGQSLDLLKLAMRKQATANEYPQYLAWEKKQEAAKNYAEKSERMGKSIEDSKEHDFVYSTHGRSPLHDKLRGHEEPEQNAVYHSGGGNSNSDFRAKEFAPREHNSPSSFKQTDSDPSSLAKYLTPEGLAMIGGGAALGGGAGAMMGGKHRGRNALLGALLGGGAGAGADYYMHKGASDGPQELTPDTGIPPGNTGSLGFDTDNSSHTPEGAEVAWVRQQALASNPLAKYLTPEGLAMIGGGAALGGGAGALLGGGEHRGRNAAIGALLGGGAGAGADYLHANPEMYKSLLGGQ